MRPKSRGISPCLSHHTIETPLSAWVWRATFEGSKKSVDPCKVILNKPVGILYNICIESGS